MAPLQDGFDVEISDCGRRRGQSRWGLGSDVNGSGFCWWQGLAGCQDATGSLHFGFGHWSLLKGILNVCFLLGLLCTFNSVTIGGLYHGTTPITSRSAALKISVGCLWWWCRSSCRGRCRRRCCRCRIRCCACDGASIASRWVSQVLCRPLSPSGQSCPGCRSVLSLWHATECRRDDYGDDLGPCWLLHLGDGGCLFRRTDRSLLSLFTKPKVKVKRTGIRVSE